MEAEQQWRMSVNLARGRSAFPDEVIRRICQWMPTQRDINDLALVSRQFRRVANAVLWEKPVFHNAEAFVKFFASITDHADLRLRVQHLTLCRPDVAFASNGSAASFYSTDDTHTDKTMADAEHACLFLPLSFANSERHNHMQQTDLADPHNILSLAQTCERLRFLRIYGWNMTRRDLDQLADHCSELQVLHIIGSDAQVWSGRHAPMPRLLPRLTGLVLDGTCYLRHEKVSETIATSCYSLSKLQLSLAEVTNANILWTLTNHPDRVITNLCDFVLTDAQPLVDDHVDRVVRAFPHLRRLCLEGSTRLTVDAVRSVVIHCRKIEHLEIRQAANTPLHMPYSTPDWALKRPAATLNTLLLDHVPLDDAAADNISRYCPALRKIGLRAIGDQLSPELLTRLITSYPFLRHLSVSHTPALDADVLSQLPTERMFTLFIENAGLLDVDDVYALCCRATPDLRCVVLDGYPALAPMADYGKRSNTSHSRIVLDEQAMDAIKESPDFKILPEDRTVTGYQLDLLAKEIQMPLNQLVELLDSLPMAPDTPYSSRRSSEDYETPTAKVHRPTTPALWTLGITGQQDNGIHLCNDTDYDDEVDDELAGGRDSNGSINFHDNHRSISSSNSNIINTDSSYKGDLFGSDDNDAIDADDDDEEQDDDDNDDFGRSGDDDHGQDHAHAGWQEAPAASLATGGYGCHSTIPWKKNTRRGASWQQKQQQQQKQYAANSADGGWQPQTEQDFEQQWQPQPLDLPTEPLRKGQKSYTTVAADQWGSAPQYVPWSETAPYVKDVVEQQERETFYCLHPNGWEVLPKSAAGASPTSSSPPLTKPKSQLKNKYSRAHQHPPPTSLNHPSDDEPIDLDEDDGVTFTTSQHEKDTAWSTPNTNPASQETTSSSSPPLSATFTTTTTTNTQRAPRAAAAAPRATSTSTTRFSRRSSTHQRASPGDTQQAAANSWKQYVAEQSSQQQQQQQQQQLLLAQQQPLAQQPLQPLTQQPHQHQQQHQQQPLVSSQEGLLIDTSDTVYESPPMAVSTTFSELYEVMGPTTTLSTPTSPAHHYKQQQEPQQQRLVPPMVAKQPHTVAEVDLQWETGSTTPNATSNDTLAQLLSAADSPQLTDKSDLYQPDDHLPLTPTEQRSVHTTSTSSAYSKQLLDLVDMDDITPAPSVSVSLASLASDARVFTPISTSVAGTEHDRAPVTSPVVPIVHPESSRSTSTISSINSEGFLGTVRVKHESDVHSIHLHINKDPEVEVDKLADRLGFTDQRRDKVKRHTIAAFKEKKTEYILGIHVRDSKK